MEIEKSWVKFLVCDEEAEAEYMPIVRYFEKMKAKKGYR